MVWPGPPEPRPETKGHRRRLSKPNPAWTSSPAETKTPEKPEQSFLHRLRVKIVAKKWPKVSALCSRRKEESTGSDETLVPELRTPFPSRSNSPVETSQPVSADALKWGHILDIGDTALVKLTLRHIGDDQSLRGVGCFVSWRGSYSRHRLHLIKFHNGAEFLVRVPVNGQPGQWTEEDGDCLCTEAKTMAYIEIKTELPVPRVYGYGDGFDNEINAPYILMDRLNGQSITEAWKSVDPGSGISLIDKRNNICRSLATAISRLHVLSFARIGMLDFESMDPCSSNGPRISTSYHQSHSTVTRGRLSDLVPSGGISHRLPCNRSRIYFRSALTGRPAHRSIDDPSPLTLGAAAIFSLVLDFVPYCETPSVNVAPQRQSWNSTTSWNLPSPKAAETFVIAHPSNMAPQNVLVNEIGEVVGIVDWAGVCVVPRCIGYAALPCWLRRQWGEAAWEPWREGQEDPMGLGMTDFEEEERRAVYVEAMRTALMKAIGGTQEDNDARFTAQSIVYCAVEEALHGDGDAEAIAAQILRTVLPRRDAWRIMLMLGERREGWVEVEEEVQLGLRDWFVCQDEAWDDAE